MAEMKANNRESGKSLDAFKAALERALADFHVTGLSAAQTDRLVEHYRMMTEWNRHTNLTRITEPQEAARRHYAESIFGGRFIGRAQKLLDIGSGAGFPALPLAVACPRTEVTALEANQKKALFLLEVKDALRIENFTVVRSRVEDFDLRPYDWLSSRALDRAEEVMPGVVTRMGAGQRLMLYCAPEMVEHLRRRLPTGFQIESHAIPLAAARLVALVRRPPSEP